MEVKVDALIGLGTSIGFAPGNLRLALQLLDACSSSSVLASSLIYRSPPLGPGKMTYHNLCAVLRTSLTPLQLLSLCKEIEQKMGRQKRPRWSDRVIDLDIVLMGDTIFDSDHLQIPHPSFLDRSFVLLPALEVAPNMRHPVHSKALRHLKLSQDWPCWPVGALSVAMTPGTRYK